MGLFDFLRAGDINEGVAEFQKTPGAVLLDVRTREEYREGHLPDSLNIELQNLQAVLEKVPDKNTPLFVYCLSGGRSSQAVSALRRAGYTSVTNIGGIGRYTGRLER